jgi:1-acyl-sn-glycerol-3-phosphate acyltransferase
LGDVKKCVIIGAPHTSNYDFFLGRLTYWALGIKIHFLIKKEWFSFPFGFLARWMGGIPVDRSRPSRLTDDVVRMFEENKRFYVIITPEGTRSLRKQWKKGFYYIAMKAGVPIALGYADYARKKGGIGPLLYPSGNLEEDMKTIEAFYSNITARHPEKFNLSPMHRQKSA